MIGPLSVGKEAAKAGYRKFGTAGAVAGGVVGAGGFLAVRRALKNRASADADTASNGTSNDGDGDDAGGGDDTDEGAA